VLSAAMVVIFVLSTAVLSMAFVLGGIIGLLVNGCVAGLYTITPALYRPDIRATGVGVALGIGRLGAILAPISAGILLDAAWTTVQLYLAVAVMFVIGAVAVGFIRKPKSDDATVSRRFAAST
jgi:MFS family permease